MTGRVLKGADTARTTGDRRGFPGDRRRGVRSVDVITGLLRGVALVAACLLLTSCASAGGAPSPASTAAWGSERSVRHDSTQPVFLSWPVVPDAAALGEMVHADLLARESAFLDDYMPNDLTPPELHATWVALVDAPGGVAGVRSEVYEFAGASGALTSESLYADRATGRVWRGSDLVGAGRVGEIARAVAASLRASGYKVPDAEAEDVGERLLADLTFTRAGDLVVRVGEGELLAFSEGARDVVVPAAAADPLLTDAGRRVRAAFAAFAVEIPAETPPPDTDADPAPSPTPTVPEPSVSGGRVDCARVACVALTFDDGPGQHTERLLDELASSQAPATFFLLGQNVARQPQVVARMAAAGHEIGNHTWDHKQLTKLGVEAQRREIDRAAAAIAGAGARATVFRPPYGSHNATTDAVAGLPVVLWDVDTLDWKTRDTDATVKAALSGAKPGSIVLMHDIHEPTVAAVPRIVAGLRERGFTLVTVSELLGDPQPGKVYTRRS